jgi:hypothetical protein
MALPHYKQGLINDWSDEALLAEGKDVQQTLRRFVVYSVRFKNLGRKMKTKFVLLITLFLLFSSIGSVQAKKSKTAVAPKFTGSPEKQKAAFKSFIIKNIGKRVYLKLTFSEEEPHAYRSEVGDPVFSVDRD